MKIKFKLILAVQTLFVLLGCNQASTPDMILFNGKIITIDQESTSAQAVAVKDGKIIAVGSDDEIRKMAGDETKVIDVKGKTVIPGLNDAHTHPEMASVSELNEKIPDIHTMADLFSWIKSESEVKKPGEWIIMPKMFFARLRELVKPSLAQLDSLAPHHPVFLNGSYGGMINTAAMKKSNVTKENAQQGFMKDEKTGELTGYVRGSAFKLIDIPRGKALSYQEKLDALHAMLLKYNEIGITSICSGDNDEDNFKMYQDLRKADKLTVRIFQNVVIPKNGPKTLNKLIDSLRAFNCTTGTGDEWIRFGALKVLLDGGILTGTAYMREPWGDKAAKIFGITDTTYRGIVNYSREDLLMAATAANELNWKFTAHSTGGGGVDLLLDVYGEVNKSKSIKDRRFSIIHGNFYTKEAIAKMKELGVCADMQPAWFYKDADAMKEILGDKRIKTFHNYRSLLDGGVMVNGGSDHMVKMDASTSINPYNPFIGMWTIITRKTERSTVIEPSESITREEALKIYTINNAYASFEETIKGSIEKGKLADMVVISEDIMTCPEDQIKDIVPEMTIVGGIVVYSSGKIE